MNKKCFLSRVLVVLLLFLAVVGCEQPNELGESDVAQSVDTSRTALSNNSWLSDYGYRYGQSMAFLDPSKSYTLGLMNQEIAANRDFLLAEYEDWKRNYITSSGAGGYLRVQRDYCLGSGLCYNAIGYENNWDTVSEGIAYGMLLAVYFNDQPVFDNLWKYAQLHQLSSTVPLMHWKVKRDGTDISEFGKPVPHDYAYYQRPQWEQVLKGTRNPDDIAYSMNSSAFPTGYNYTGINPYYLRASGSKRSKNSASDADYDIAAALCIASRKWTTPTISGINYVNDACQQVKAVVKYDLTSGNFIKNGRSWGDEYCWNPSYFMPNWFRMYTSFINANRTAYGSTADSDISKLNATVTKVYAHMLRISRSTSAGLFPDWCDTSDNGIKKADGSDRTYFVDDNGDGIIDDRNGDGKLSVDDAVTMQSYNFYYDAIRTPWRMAMDYSWYGAPEAQEINNRIGSFFYGKSRILVDGYAIDGTSWKRADRDGFNNILPSQNGGSGYSTTFVAMIGPAYMESTNVWRKYQLYQYYTALKAKKDPTGVYTKYHYYGNTLRMLSLLYMSGYMTNPY
jgi:hypothetical protein